MSRWETTVIALAATFLGGWWLGQYVSRPEIVERVQLVREPYAWELGPAMGTWMTRDGSGMWAGAYARRTFGRFSVSAAAGYDARNKSAFGQVEAGMALWRR